MALYTPFAERTVDKVAGAIQQKNQTTLAQSAYMGDTSALNKLASINPEFAQKIQMQKNQQDQAKMQQAAQAQQANLKKQEIAKQIAKDSAKMPFEEAASYAQSQAQAYNIELPPLTPEHHAQFQKIYGAHSDTNIGQVSPKDFTVESLAEYSKTGDIKGLTRYLPQVKDIAGIPHQVNPMTQKWEPIVDMTSPGITEQAKAIAKIEADKQSEKDFAKSKMKWQDSETQIISAIDSADSKTKILDNTTSKLKELLDDRVTKYGTGLLSRFPATDERTIKGLITTIEANSTFTTLTDLKAAGGTLGAIAQKELELLSSALGMLDQAGNAEEMIRVLDQISQANTDSVRRLRDGYARDKERYSKGFQSDAQAETDKPQADKFKGAPPGYAERRARLLGGQ